MMANKADIVTLMKGNTPKYVRSHVDAPVKCIHHRG